MKWQILKKIEVANAGFEPSTSFSADEASMPTPWPHIYVCFILGARHKNPILVFVPRERGDEWNVITDDGFVRSISENIFLPFLSAGE